MDVHKTKSTVIKQVVYFPGSVTITFRNGSEYIYDVPRKRAYNNLVQSRSIGKYFNKTFKRFYGPGFRTI